MTDARNQIVRFKLFSSSASRLSVIFIGSSLSCGRNLKFSFALIYTELSSTFYFLFFLNRIWVETLAAALLVLFKLSLESWRFFRISCPFSKLLKANVAIWMLHCRGEMNCTKLLSEQSTTEHSSRAEQSPSQN